MMHFFLTLFQSLSKESRIQKELDKFSAYVFYASILYYNSRVSVPQVGGS